MAKALADQGFGTADHLARAAPEELGRVRGIGPLTAPRLIAAARASLAQVPDAQPAPAPEAATPDKAPEPVSPEAAAEMPAPANDNSAKEPDKKKKKS